MKFMDSLRVCIGAAIFFGTFSGQSALADDNIQGKAVGWYDQQMNFHTGTPPPIPNSSNSSSNTSNRNTGPSQQQIAREAAHDQNQHGVAAYKSGDFATAVADFEHALANAPTDTNIRANLASAKERLRSQKENAIAAVNMQHDLQSFAESMGSAGFDGRVGAPSPVASSGLEFMTASAGYASAGARPSIPPSVTTLAFGDPNVVDARDVTPAQKPSAAGLLKADFAPKQTLNTREIPPAAPAPKSAVVQLEFGDPNAVASPLRAGAAHWPGPTRPASERLKNPLDDVHPTSAADPYEKYKIREEFTEPQVAATLKQAALDKEVSADAQSSRTPTQAPAGKAAKDTAAQQTNQEPYTATTIRQSLSADQAASSKH